MGLVAHSANCGTMGDWFKNKGQSIAWSATPKRGDIVFFDFTGKHTTRQHVGIVEKVNADGSLTTIEGNTSVTSNDNGGAVMRRTRYKYQVVHYGRPAYASDAELESYMALAVEQIGVTEYPSGSNKVKYNTWYYGREVSGTAYPWCAVWVCWIYLSGEKASGTTATTTTTTTGGTTVTITLNTLKRGSTGAQVKALQRILYARLGSAYKVDGEFGATTEKGVIKVQKQLGLYADGVVGKNTWTALLTQMS